MELTLTEPEATELRDLFDGSLGDLSSEIAATDNPSYRVARRAARGTSRPCVPSWTAYRPPEKAA